MRAIAVVVVGFLFAGYIVLPAVQKYDPSWFPDSTKPVRANAVSIFHNVTAGAMGCSGNGADTNTMTPRLPRITTTQTIRALVTAYDPYDKECVGDNAGILPRRTPTGDDVEQPGVAVDLAVIPAGSKIEIPNVGTFTADDTGCAMRLAARNPDIANYYQIDVRIPAPYDSFPNNPTMARKEAHAIAAGLGAHWVEVNIAPPNAADSHNTNITPSTSD